MNAENFNNHIVFEKLKLLKDTLDSEAIKESIDLENYNFFTSAYSFINAKLKLTMPILLQEGELTSLTSEIDAGIAYLNNFIGSKNIGYITNSVNSFNSAINRIRSFPIPLAKGDFDYSKMVANFQKASQDGLESIKAENEKLKSALEVIQVTLVERENQLTELNALLINKKDEIQSVLDGYNIQFDAILQKAKFEFDEERKKIIESIEADRKNLKKEIAEDKQLYNKEYIDQKSTLEKDTSDTIISLNAKLEEAKKIVNIVGDIGVTGNYQKIASEHKTTANTFRWISIGIMIVMSGLLIWTIIDLSNAGFDLYKSIVRIVAATILTYPAIYASKESSKHRILETKNRNLELELASLGPFIELLSEDKKEKIKEDLVYKYFGNGLPVENEKEDEDDVSINGLEKILKALLPLIKK